MAVRTSDPFLTMPTNDGLTIITDIKLLGTAVGTAWEAAVKGDGATYLGTIKAFSMSLRLVDFESPHEFQVTTYRIYRDAKRFLRLLAFSKNSKCLIAYSRNIQNVKVSISYNVQR